MSSTCCQIRHTSAFSVAANHLPVPFQRIAFGYVQSGGKALEAVKYQYGLQELIAVYEYLEWRRAKEGEQWISKDG